MHFSDLTPLLIPPLEASSQLIAVGWLEPGHDYQRGEVLPEFVRKLVDLLVDPWQPAVALGRHSCGFCRFTGGPTSICFGSVAVNTVVKIGVSNLWLPADGFLFVAPSLILHYMDSHGYSPPVAFQEAAIACPPMRSMEYLKAVLKNGPKGIVTK
jgi:hypothetical protein